MKTKIKRISVSTLIAVIFLLGASCAMAAPGSQKASAKAPMSGTVKDMTKDEIIKEIADELDNEDEILQVMPQLKKENDAAGKGYYTFNGRRLEDLDNGTLEKLSNNVQTQATMIRANRINEQLETMRNIRRATQAVRPMRTPPRVITVAPPALGAAHRTPARPPRTPPAAAAPPTPPRAR